MRQLEIYHNQAAMGILTQESQGLYIFAYYSSYLVSELPPLSLSMPKRDEAYTSTNLFPFFVALLPEGTNRKTICIQNKIDEEDDFSLLAFFAEKDIIGSTYIKFLNNE